MKQYLLKKQMYFWLLVVFMINVVVVMPNINLVSVEAANNSYYVDSVYGNDDNDGKSIVNAWKSLNNVNKTTFKPGDKIFFKAGGSWKGTLAPKGSGIKDSPIIISMYGTGSKPLVEGPGTNESAALLLENQEYWEINNLKITNPNGDPKAKKRGIYVLATDTQWTGTSQNTPKVLQHIYIKNCEIYNVDSDFFGMLSSGKCYGGIIFQIKAATGSNNWVKFDDILIENNYIHDLSRNGLYMHSDYNMNGNYTNSGGDGNHERVGWTNVKVRNNYVAGVGGDGLVVTNCDYPLMEYNVVAYPHRKPGIGLYAVGMGVFGCMGAVLQYNESFGNQTTNDGQGFGLDFASKNSVLQYNFSHDNEGGFVLVCSGPGINENPIVRYNVSQNDGCIIGSRIFQVSGVGTKNAQIYNNTIYTAAEPNLRIVQSGISEWYSAPINTYFMNNLIWNRSVTPSFEYTDSTKYIANLFYGVNPPIGATKSKIADPKLTKPGFGTIGGRVDLGELRGSVDGFKLLPTSPCINNGVSIKDNGGKDYSGSPLYRENPDIGAFEYWPIENKAEPSSTENKDIFYENDSTDDIARMKKTIAYNYDCGIERVDSGKVKTWFVSKKNSIWVELYYSVDSGIFEKVNMTKNNGIWEYTINAPEGSTINYYYRYEKLSRSLYARPTDARNWIYEDD